MISAAWGGLTSLDDLAILRLVLEAAQALLRLTEHRLCANPLCA